jgi:para-nitrobenzyl esterase
MAGAHTQKGPDPIVETQRGTVRGTDEDGITSFRGIPFAAPPTGSRRFLPPVAAQPWRQTLDARHAGPAPPQIVDALSKSLGLDFPGPIQEDALQLNVWTPGPAGTPRPVLVWLHGGAFATGSGTSPLYAGNQLAARGDVVVVTINYRVGALGFSHLAPLLSHAPAGSGANLGLQDQLAALRWVQDEIAAFGGDPQCVTAFGESAGAGSLCALLAMPSARGLFQRAIIQSAAPDGILSEDEGRARAIQLVGALGLDARNLDLEKLQQLPMERILEAQQTCIEAGPHRTGMFFAPVIDGETLPERPLDAVAKGAASGIPLLIGTTEQEMQLYATVPGLGDFPDEVLVKVVASRIEGSEAERENRAARAVAIYRSELAAAGAGEPSQRDLFFALETDLSLRLPSLRLAEHQVGFEPRTYAYLFRWRSPMPDGHGGTLGACHALDLPFTFGALTKGAARDFAAGADATSLERARTLSNHMIDAWTAFARSGDPSHPGLGPWPGYDTSRRTTMLLGETCEPCEAPLEARRAIWE